MAKAADELRDGMVNLPCDVVHTPSSTRSAIKRVNDSLPPKTPFKVLHAAARDLKRVEMELSGKPGC